jgi:membrane protein
LATRRIRTNVSNGANAPSGPKDIVKVKSLLDAVHCFDEQDGDCRVQSPDRGIQEIESRLDTAIGQALGDMTLRDLADRLDGPQGVPAR